jgi:selenocysteine lyase/cysteine desulfurase
MAAGHPLEENWINREDAENFAGLVEYRDAYEPGARRYDMGEKSNFFLTPIAKASMEQILEWGVDNISATLGALNQDIAQRTQALGLEPVPQERRAPHLLGIRFPPGAAAKLAAELAEAKVFVSVRGDSMRISPHLYNNAADVERLLEHIKKA